jgi:hypothetical protein
MKQYKVTVNKTDEYEIEFAARNRRLARRYVQAILDNKRYNELTQTFNVSYTIKSLHKKKRFLLAQHQQHKQITKAEYNTLLRSAENKKYYEPRGTFYFKDGKVWLAIDNSAGDCFVEEFKTLEKAILWLEMR